MVGLGVGVGVLGAFFVDVGRGDGVALNVGVAVGTGVSVGVAHQVTVAIDPPTPIGTGNVPAAAMALLNRNSIPAKTPIIQFFMGYLLPYRSL